MQVSGGTLSSPKNIGTSGGLNSSSTVALFEHTSATSAAVLWTAPSTAGSYTISLYSSTTTTGVALANPTAGTSAVASITVTVGGTHPLVDGTNSPDTLGAINGSMFTAVASNTGATAVVHPATTLGVGETMALSKGLLYKTFYYLFCCFLCPCFFKKKESAVVAGGEHAEEGEENKEYEAVDGEEGEGEEPKEG